MVFVFEQTEQRCIKLVSSVPEDRVGNFPKPALGSDRVIPRVCLCEEDEEVYLMSLIVIKAFEQSGDSVANILFL